MLKINTTTDEVSFIGEPLRGSKKRPDGKYKFLGGVNGDDGNVYCMPADSDHVLKIDVRAQTVSYIGETLEFEEINHTKWQNGFMGKDGCIYGIPLNGRTILRIDIKRQSVSVVAGPYMQLGKWEGGVVDRNGDLYCMPLCHKHVLRIAPRGSRQINVAGGWGGGRAHD